MVWTVSFHDDFDPEFDALAQTVQIAMLESLLVLQQIGPLLGRPHVDTLAGSQFPNMKELRFAADNGVWRVAFAFDPEREAIVLVAGDKAGVAQRRFYKSLITKADERFASHLAKLKGK